MNVTKFSIENYRSLKKIEISDFGKTTIFYGDNNAGKSNILNALHLIFMRKPKLSSGKDEGLSQVENFYEGVVIDSQNSYYNNITSSNITFSVDIEVAKTELSIDTEIKALFSTGSKFTFTFQGTMSFIGSSENDYSDFRITAIKKGTAIIYSNDVDVAFFPSLDKTKKKQSQLSKAFTHLIDIFNDCVYIVSSDRDMHETLLEHEAVKHISPKTFKKFLYSLYLSPKHFHFFEQINTAYSQPPFSFGTISFSKDAGKLEIMIKEKDFRLPIKHLGSGALQALYIISSIVYSRSKIVCLEELEQNLSPKKQFEILRKIQTMIDDPHFSLDQLLISSHSSVYAKPKIGTIYFLEKTDGETKIENKEGQKIGKKLKSHIAYAQTEYDPKEFEEIKKYLKEHHDFE